MNDDELIQRVVIINGLIQEIQNYIGPSDPDKYDNNESKIRFPSGYLRTAHYFKSRLAFMRDETLKKNIAYCLIEADLFTWLINRTRITGTLKEMIIKSGIVKMGSISEATIRHLTKGRISRNLSFIDRCNRMEAMEMITQEICDELHWLWNARKAIHLYLLGDAEYSKYSEADYDRAFLATRSLINHFS